MLHTVDEAVDQPPVEGAIGSEGPTTTLMLPTSITARQP